MLYALCDRSSRSARPPGCARVDSRLDTAKIGSDGRVEAHGGRLRAVFGRRKTFPHGLGQKLKSCHIQVMSASARTTDVVRRDRRVRKVRFPDTGGPAQREENSNFCVAG